MQVEGSVCHKMCSRSDERLVLLGKCTGAWSTCVAHGIYDLFDLQLLAASDGGEYPAYDK